MKEQLKLKGNNGIWIAVILLLAASVIIMASTSTVLGYRTGQSHILIWARHTLFALVSFWVVFRTSRADYRKLRNNPWLIPTFYWLTVGLLLLTLIAGIEINDARRWLRIPGIGIRFQTSDLARIALMLFLAYRYAHKPFHRTAQTPFKETMQDQFFRYIFPITLTTGLIMIADLSTAVLTGLTAFAFLFLIGIPLRYLIAWAGLGTAVLAVFLFTAPYLGIERAATWKNRLMEMQSETPSYQPRLAQAAIHKGNFIIGTGPGGSILRDFLPNSFSDYVYAIIIEEYGWLGMIYILAGFILLFIQGLRIFHRTPHPFGRAIVIGMTLLITLQALFHIMVNVGLFPVTGLTLPLVSMGGTSMLILSFSIGLILSVARIHQAEADSAGKAPAPSDTNPHAAYE